MSNGRPDFKEWAFGGGKFFLWFDVVCLWIVSHFGVLAVCVFDEVEAGEELENRSITVFQFFFYMLPIYRFHFIK